MRNWLSVPLSPTGSSYTNIVVSDNEDLIAGTVKAVLQGNGEVIRLPTNIYSGAIGGTWNATDRLTLNGEFSYSNASQDYKQSYLRADTKKSVPVDFDFRGTDVPSISYPDTLDLTDPPTHILRTVVFDFEGDAVTTAGRKVPLVRRIRLKVPGQSGPCAAEFSQQKLADVADAEFDPARYGGLEP